MSKYSQFIHDYRVFPRLVLLGYSVLLYDVVGWFKGLADPTTQQTALITAIVGLSAAIFGFYTTTVSGLQKK